NSRKRELIPDEVFYRLIKEWKVAYATTYRWARGALASWWDKSLPRRRCVADQRGRSATLGLRHGPDSYGRQQKGIFRNGRKSDGATPRERRRSSDHKALLLGKNKYRSNRSVP